MAFPVPYQGLQLSTAFVDLNLSYICILRTILRLERISVVRYRARVVSTVVDVVTSTPPAIRLRRVSLFIASYIFTQQSSFR